MKAIIYAAALASLPSSCDGFLNFMNHANPALTGYAEAQDAVLKIHLDIGAYVQEKRGGTPIVSGVS